MNDLVRDLVYNSPCYQVHHNMLNCAQILGFLCDRIESGKFACDGKDKNMLIRCKDLLEQAVNSCPEVCK